MKNSQKVFVVPLLIIAVLVIAVGVYYFLQYKSVPSKYQASEMSKSWPVYTNNEYGFHIKYPDTNWSYEASSNRVSFRPDGSADFSIYAGKESVDSRIATVKNSVTGSCSVEKTLVSINDALVRKMTCEIGYFDSAGNKENSFLYLEKNGITYEISFSLGRGSLKNDKNLQDEYKEMVGTFGFNQITNSGQLTFVHPKYNYSIAYPDSWHIITGDHLGLDSSVGDRIDVYATENTTFEKYQQFQGNQINDCTAKKEYFAHKLMGQKCDWLGRETYFFEKNGNLYSISLTKKVSSTNVFDTILNSFTI
ncbi:MAG: hypothetical protein WCP09_02930 [Candidatus Taylorbacteria bacterium]